MIVWFQIEQKRYTINNVTEQFAKGESTPLEGLYSFSTRAVYGHLPVFLKRIYCILKHVRNDGKGCYSSSSSRSAPPFELELVLRSRVTRKMTIINLCTFYVWSFSDTTGGVIVSQMQSTVQHWSREWQGKGKGSRRSWSSGHFQSHHKLPFLVLERLAVWFTYRMTHSTESQHIGSQTKNCIFYANQ